VGISKLNQNLIIADNKNEKKLDDPEDGGKIVFERGQADKFLT
jgi:hypothetical protein